MVGRITSADISDVIPMDKFCQRRLDISQLLNDGIVPSLIVSAGVQIPFKTKNDMMIPIEIDDDLVKAVRYVGNSLIKNIMSKVLKEIYPFVYVRIPKTEHDNEKIVERPSAAFSVVDYVPYACHLTKKDYTVGIYEQLIKSCLFKAVQYTLNMMMGEKCVYNPQIHDGSPVKGYFIYKEKRPKIEENMPTMHNFGRRFMLAEKVASSLNEKLIEANQDRGISAAEIKDFLEDFIAKCKV